MVKDDLVDELVDELVKKCNKCGNENSSDSRFCKICGDNLEDNISEYDTEHEYEYGNENTIEDTQPISLKEIEEKLNKRKFLKKIKFPKVVFPQMKAPKINFKLPRVNFKPANNKKKIIILTFILLISFSAVAYFYSTPGTKMILSYYGQNKRPDKLISYIDKNKKNEEKKELVSYGMNQIFTNNMVSGMNFLNEELYNKENSADFLNWIVLQMKNSKVLPEDSVKFSSYYIDNYILLKSEKLDTEFWNQYIALMKNYPNEEIKNGFYSNVSELYLDNKLEEAIKVMIALNTIKIGVESENKTIISLIEKIKVNGSTITKDTTKSEDILESIKNNVSEIEAENTLLTEVTTEIEKTNSEISELKQKLSVKQNYSKLRYYCVAKHKSGVYEIVLPKNSAFFGEILSNTHAIIYTNDSSLSLNSWGNLKVYDNGYKTVTLDTYGGVKQDLMTYKEVSKKNFAEINSILASVDENKTVLTTFNETLVSYKNKIKEIEDENINLQEEKNNLLAGIESLKNDNISNDLEIKKLMKIK